MDLIKNDVGTVLEATIKDQDGVVVDISSSTLRTFKFHTPSKTLVSKSAVLSGSGTDGKLRYVTVADDLNVTGTWTLQVYIEIGAGVTFHTSVAVFDVDAILT